jgi:F-type H+-transporting ATPase subunit delta
LAKVPTAKRYAQALFELALEGGSQEAWLDELRLAQEALGDPTVGVYLGTPRVRIVDKLGIVAQLMEDREPLVASLVGLLVSRHASSLLDAVADAYGDLLNERLGRVRADVTTASTLSAEQQTRLQESLGSMLAKEVMLDTHEDPDIIGGVIVRVGDQIIDGSVRTRLIGLRQRLERGSLA